MAIDYSNHSKDKPSTHMLAGVFVFVEGPEDFSIVPSRLPDESALLPKNTVPTKDQLAGRFVLIDAPEDLSVHPPRPIENGQSTKPSN